MSEGIRRDEATVGQYNQSQLGERRVNDLKWKKEKEAGCPHEEPGVFLEP